jgi:hypothetical protein
VEHCTTFDHMPPAVELNDVHVALLQGIAQQLFDDVGAGADTAPPHNLPLWRGA